MTAACSVETPRSAEVLVETTTRTHDQHFAYNGYRDLPGQGAQTEMAGVRGPH